MHGDCKEQMPIDKLQVCIVDFNFYGGARELLTRLVIASVKQDLEYNLKEK